MQPLLTLNDIEITLDGQEVPVTDFVFDKQDGIVTVRSEGRNDLMEMKDVSTVFLGVDGFQFDFDVKNWEISELGANGDDMLCYGYQADVEEVFEFQEE